MLNLPIRVWFCLVVRQYQTTQEASCITWYGLNFILE